MRLLKASLTIGILSSLLVLGLATSGAFQLADHALMEFSGPGLAKPLLLDTWVGFVSLLCALGIAWVTVDVVLFPLKTVLAAAAFLQVLGLAWVLGLHGIFFPPFEPALAILLSFGFGILYSRSESGGRKRLLQSLFEGRISRRSFYALLDSDAPLAPGGAAREASVLVCEIFNRDELTEGMPVAERVALNNLFLRVSADFLLQCGAYLDQCDGEGVRAVFGVPLPAAAHAAAACKAALELAQRLEVLNFECKSKWHTRFDFRIGVDSGEVIAAVYGPPRTELFAVSGEPVDFARRLCAGNLAYGSRILTGPGTLALASGAVEVRPLELIPTRDERTREEIYELIGLKNALPEEELKLRDHFWKGVIYYREQLPDEALDCFRAAINPDRKDPPLEHYIRRIEQLRAGNPVPGPAHWSTPLF